MRSSIPSIPQGLRANEPPEVHASKALSELDFGLRVMAQMIPGIVQGQADRPSARTLNAHRSRVIQLRSGLLGFAKGNGMTSSTRHSEELDMLLNELRGNQMKAKYGRLRPSAVLPPLWKLWKALMLRWNVLVETTGAFMDKQARTTVMVLYEEAKGMEAALVEAMISETETRPLS